MSGGLDRVPHPFFEAAAYPWHLPTATALHRALSEAVTRYPAIELHYRSCASGLPGLPNPETPETQWKFVLEKLTTARRLSTLCERLLNDPSLAAIAEQVRAVVEAGELDEATDRVDSNTITDRVVIAVGLELTWHSESPGRKVLVESQRVAVDAVVTVRSDGAAPEPTLSIVEQTLFGKKAIDVRVRRDPAGTDGHTRWIATFPVEPGRLLTKRIVAVAKSKTESFRVSRYVMSFTGSIIGLLLWVLLIGFVGWWLMPLGAAISVTGLALTIVMFGSGWLLTRVKELSLGWVTRVWETTLVLAAVLAALTVILPHFLFVMVVNRSTLTTTIEGIPIDPDKRSLFLRGIELKPMLAKNQCACPIECKCIDDDVRFVPHFEIHCVAVEDQKCADKRMILLADAMKIRPGLVDGTISVPLDYPEGFRMLELPRDLLSRATTIRSDAAIQFSAVRVKAGGPATIKVPAFRGTELKIEADHVGVLSCSIAGDEPVRVATIGTEQPTKQLTIALGEVKSEWSLQTTRAPARACVTRAKRATIGLDGIASGQAIELPTDLGIEEVAYEGSQPVECPQLDRLRFVKLINTPSNVPIGGSRVVSVQPGLGMTCGPPDRKIDIGQLSCVLAHDEFRCTRPNAGYEGPCTLKDERPVQGSIPGCRALKKAQDPNLWEKLDGLAKAKGWRCTAHYACE